MLIWFQINVLMESWKQLHEENIDLKKKEKDLKVEAELQREDNKVLLKKNTIQNRVSVLKYLFTSLGEM